MGGHSNCTNGFFFVCWSTPSPRSYFDRQHEQLAKIPPTSKHRKKLLSRYEVELNRKPVAQQGQRGVMSFVRSTAHGVAQDDHPIAEVDSAERRREDADICLTSRDYQRLDRVSSQHQIQATTDPG